MSFALEFRRKMQAEAKRKARGRKTRAAKVETGFVLSPPRKNADTRGNRRHVLAALSLAGIILSVFNSGAMVHYAGGLGYNALSMRVITMTENWHRLMEESRLTLVVEEIREVITTARHSSWQDMALGLSLTPSHPYLTPVPVRSDQPAQREIAPVEPGSDDVQEKMDRPVMRAAVEPNPE